MERQKYSLIVSLSSLCVAVIALVVGFSAFSDSTKINTTAKVQQTDNFRVELANNNSGAVSTSAITATDSGATKGATGTGSFTAYNGGTSSIDLSATFTDIGEELTYTFYARNMSSYKAFLNSLIYDGSITCTTDSTSSNPGNAAMITEACKTITLEVSVAGNVTDTLTVSSATSKTTVTPTQSHYISDTNGYDTITVKVKYNGSSDAATNYGRVDGDFTVSFGTITFNYASTDVSHS